MHFENLALYRVDFEYINYLYKNHNEVYFDESYANSIKPFVGILILKNDYTYFIPLTSAKQKHVNWRNKTKSHFLINKLVESSHQHPNAIYKTTNNSNQKIHILGVLDFKKMIPVPRECTYQINMTTLNNNYRNLLIDEFEFIKSHQDSILRNIDKMYTYQINNNKILPYHCDFKLLEHICDKYKK